MLAADTVLQGRYRIVQQLGQGGMGAVYEAVDERLDTIVALKETLFTEEKLRKQFEREARLLARLHHQALPRVSDHFGESEGQFLVMQYIAGDDLAEMLSARNAPFPEGDVMRWADQLCDALDYLHTQDPQIIHRDIKPQNLKLTARGQVVLLDFGLAKGSAGQLTAVTTSASIFGYTPNYAPLEQVQGMGTDARSDLYSLAATLFHLVTNVKPPDALSRAAAVVNGEPDPLSPANQVSPNITSSFANVLHKGMSLKRDDRFMTATAMRDALRIAADDPTADAATLISAGPAVASNSSTLIGSERVTKLVRSQTQRGGPPSVASEAQTLVAGEATSVREPVVAASVPPARHNRMAWITAAVLLVVLCGCAAAFYAYRARNQASAPVREQPPAESQPLQSSQPESNADSNGTRTEPAKTNELKVQGTKTESGAQRATSKKSETKQNAEPVAVNPPPVTVDPEHDKNRERDRARDNPPAQPSPFDPFRFPHGNRRDRFPGGIPEIKTMPNGAKVIRQPDGSTIFIGPKGETRVVPPPPRKPGKKPNDNQP